MADEESLLVDMRQRGRDARVGPGGAVSVLTAESRLVRVWKGRGCPKNSDAPGKRKSKSRAQALHVISGWNDDGLVVVEVAPPRSLRLLVGK